MKKQILYLIMLSGLCNFMHSSNQPYPIELDQAYPMDITSNKLPEARFTNFRAWFNSPLLPQVISSETFMTPSPENEMKIRQAFTDARNQLNNIYGIDSLNFNEDRWTYYEILSYEGIFRKVIQEKMENIIERIGLPLVDSVFKSMENLSKGNPIIPYYIIAKYLGSLYGAIENYLITDPSLTSNTDPINPNKIISISIQTPTWDQIPEDIASSLLIDLQTYNKLQNITMSEQEERQLQRSIYNSLNPYFNPYSGTIVNNLQTKKLTTLLYTKHLKNIVFQAQELAKIHNVVIRTEKQSLPSIEAILKVLNIPYKSNLGNIRIESNK